jgi:hypothetical protein
LKREISEDTHLGNKEVADSDVSGELHRDQGKMIFLTPSFSLVKLNVSTPINCEGPKIFGKLVMFTPYIIKNLKTMGFRWCYDKYSRITQGAH